jgi:hypothetical protein
MDELRFVFQVETMSFKARYLAPEDALVVGHATLSRMDEARAHTPQDRQARAAQRRAALGPSQG